MLKVAVIGAGAAGLCCARHLSRYQHLFSFSVFEKGNGVGGTWVYTDRADTDEYGLLVHSSVHKALRTNIPKEITHFPDFPFDKEDLPSYVGHRDMLEYLQRYSDHFSLYKFIKFHTNVDRVEPQYITEAPEPTADPGDGLRDSVRWRVQYRDLETGALAENIFDYVLVCNGHYFEPYVPDIPDLVVFPGRVRHSHVFRTVDGLEGKRLLVVGTRASGTDIMLYAASVAREVYLVHHTAKPQYKLPPNAQHLPSVTRIEADGTVHFENGESRTVDEIVLCTGYQYSFPFLTNESRIKIEAGGKHVTPLYKHMFNIVHPSMAFIGLAYPVLPFIFFDVQVRFAVSVLTGDIQLPSQEDMEKERKTRFINQLDQGFPLRFAHRLEHFFVYLKELIEIGNLQPLSPIFEPVYIDMGKDKKHNILNLRKYDYTVTENDNGKVTFTKQLHPGETLV